MCYSIIVGKNASIDGSVLFAHSEQNYGCPIVNYRKIPRIKHNDKDVITLKNGATLKEVKETYSFLWSECPGLEFSDNYFNEWGIAIGGDGCPTREDTFEQLSTNGDIKNGGIGYMLPRLIAMRARTAKEGVEIAGKLLNEFGYSASGRTLIIADSNEAWIMAIARGKSWIAEKVPDDQVVIVPNTHIVGEEANIDDKENVLCSPKLIEYAIKKGWYNPNDKEPFSFRKAFGIYTDEESFPEKFGCDSRQWYGQYLVTGNAEILPVKNQLPFSVKPKKKLSVSSLAKILRSHLEESEFDTTKHYTLQNPHKAGIGNDIIRSQHNQELLKEKCLARNICNKGTQESTIFQLRNWLPSEIGCIAWRCTFVPCTGVFTPWYLGISVTPQCYHKKDLINELLSIEHHFNPPNEELEFDSSSAFWIFYSLSNLIDRNYAKKIRNVQKIWLSFEDEEFKVQREIEKKALDLFSINKNDSIKFITDYSKIKALNALEIAKDVKLLNLI
jgi:dipeptidase